MSCALDAGAFSIFVALFIEAGGIWFRQRFLYSDDDDET